MKTMKKLFALTLAVLMVMSLATAAFATGSDKGHIIVPSSDGHTYEAFQIFTGELSDGKFSNITWGTHGKKTGKVSDEDIAALTALNTAGNTAILEKITSAYVDFAKDDAISLTTGSNDVDIGYYLVRDTNVTAANPAFTLYLVDVAGDFTLNPKTSHPTLEKKVKDNDGDGAAINNGWIDSADYKIGATVPFQMTATLGTGMENYKQYYLKFVDTFSPGLTITNTCIKSITLGTTALTSQEIADNVTVRVTASSPATASTSAVNGTLTVEILDLVALMKSKSLTVSDGMKVVVEFDGVLNEHAEIGLPGNPNEAKLVYSNNPNEEYTTNPPTNTNETPDDTVVVFTYQVVVDKVDENDTLLPGASFELYRYVDGSDTNDVLVEHTAWAQNTTEFSWVGLDAGEYRLHEYVTPDGYNTIPDVVFTVTAEHKLVFDTFSADFSDVLTDLSGNVTSGTANFTKDTANSTLTARIENKSGIVLPSTGGVGTTMFYVIGSMLVLVAGVMLISKKRMADMTK